MSVDVRVETVIHAPPAEVAALPMVARAMRRATTKDLAVLKAILEGSAAPGVTSP